DKVQPSAPPSAPDDEAKEPPADGADADGDQPADEEPSDDGSTEPTEPTEEPPAAVIPSLGFCGPGMLSMLPLMLLGLGCLKAGKFRVRRNPR
ncbi:MAG TPA: hypothetical protein VMY37_40555, partial [Thermoguttaceae bacterium]|nr:hypothetical protein [Thermoguttaceae bacterium]